MINNVIQTILSLGKILIQSRIFKKTVQPGNVPLIILGNGPSALNTIQHPNFQRQEYQLMTVNLFASQPIFKQVKPEYYVFLDKAFFNFDLEAIQNPENAPAVQANPKFIGTQKLITETWTHILESDWDICIFIPQLFRNSPIVKKLIEQKFQIQFFNYTVVRGFSSFENWMYKNGLGSPQSQNVINTCIFQAINSEFHEIYLLGVESNFHSNLVVNEENQLMMRDDHFYEVETKWIPLRHPENRSVRMHEFYTNLTKAFYAHFRLAQYAQYRNQKIFNATENSFIDAYQRKKLPL
jgi:hypothetical protein